jgi:hypothetical protein
VHHEIRRRYVPDVRKDEKRETISGRTFAQKNKNLRFSTAILPSLEEQFSIKSAIYEISMEYKRRNIFAKMGHFLTEKRQKSAKNSCFHPLFRACGVG